MLTSPWLLGLGLGGLLAAFAAAPVIIHLINMMRHRRVKWAAMDFLLQSYKKHRNWIWLKQLLLLAMRMALLVLLALMLCTLAHYLFTNFRKSMGWKDSTIFAGVTHHYVILDDSYSMSEGTNAGSTFDRALSTVSKIGQLVSQQRNQRFTLLRYSRVAGLGGGSAKKPEEGDAGADKATAAEATDEAALQQAAAEHANRAGFIADLNGISPDSDFRFKLEETTRGFAPSQLATQPEAALRLVRALIAKNGEETAVVHLVSDFRDNKWKNPVSANAVIDEIRNAGATVELISCARTPLGNLGITEVKPLNMTRAAGVPLFVDVSVKNYGATVKKKVQLKIVMHYYDPKNMSQGQPLQRTAETFPIPLTIEEIQPGQTATAQAQIYFDQPGMHAIEATLPDDEVEADNHRWSVIDFPDGEAVLLIDGHERQLNAYFLDAFFNPGERINTGIRPQIEPKEFLREAKPEELQAYRAIYLMDVDRLDTQSVRNLTAYVKQGGGLAFFAGPNVNVKDYNEKLHDGGRGLFPVPLSRLQTDNLLVSETDEDAPPDLQRTDHPIFKNMGGEKKDSILDFVSVERFLQVEEGWTPPEDSTVRVAASLRNGAPLVVEQSLGKGRVVAFLTTLAPQWNNLAKGPMIGLALDLHGFLASNQRLDSPHSVAAPIDLEMKQGEYLDEVAFVVPGVKPAGENKPARRKLVKLQAEAIEGSDQKVVSLGRGLTSAGSLASTERAGIYEAWRTTDQDQQHVQRWAVNVEPSEGELAVVSFDKLPETLQSVFLYWDEYEPEAEDDTKADLAWTKYIVYILIGLLLLEQFVAYWASYHPVRGGAR